jgi:hypothetical protein
MRAPHRCRRRCWMACTRVRPPPGTGKGKAACGGVGQGESCLRWRGVAWRGVAWRGVGFAPEQQKRMLAVQGLHRMCPSELPQSRLSARPHPFHLHRPAHRPKSPGDPESAIAEILRRRGVSPGAGAAPRPAHTPPAAVTPPRAGGASGTPGSAPRSAASPGGAAPGTVRGSPLQSPARSPAKPRAAAGTGLLSLDMGGLHRAVHIHRCLGEVDAFRSHYFEQRRLQVRGRARASPRIEGLQADKRRPAAAPAVSHGNV